MPDISSVRPQDHAPSVPRPPKPDNYLIWAILATLLCCVPTGIAAIVYAAQVDGKWTAGDYAGAQRSSDQAKMWSWISLGVGLAAAVIYVGLALAGAGEAAYS